MCQETSHATKLLHFGYTLLLFLPFSKGAQNSAMQRKHCEVWSKEGPGRVYSAWERDDSLFFRRCSEVKTRKHISEVLNWPPDSRRWSWSNPWWSLKSAAQCAASVKNFHTVLGVVRMHVRKKGASVILPLKHWWTYTRSFHRITE